MFAPPLVASLCWHRWGRARDRVEELARRYFERFPPDVKASRVTTTPRVSGQRATGHDRASSSAAIP
jgi:hypothetical protein